MWTEDGGKGRRRGVVCECCHSSRIRQTWQYDVSSDYHAQHPHDQYNHRRRHRLSVSTLMPQSGIMPSLDYILNIWSRYKSVLFTLFIVLLGACHILIHCSSGCLSGPWCPFSRSIWLSRLSQRHTGQSWHIRWSFVMADMRHWPSLLAFTICSSSTYAQGEVTSQ